MTKRKLICILSIAASGILTAMTLQFDLMYPLSYISLAPLFYFIAEKFGEKPSYKKLYATGLLWSMCYYMTIYSFFLAMYPMEFMGVSKPVGGFLVVFCQIGLSLLQSVATAAVVPLTLLVCRHKRLLPLIFSLLWIIFEWMQNFTWAGVPFLRLAISQTSFAPAMQSASLFGSLFLSFIPALSSASLGYALHLLKARGWRFDKKILVYPTLALVLIISNIGYGAIKIASYTEDVGRQIKVALIQANIGSVDKWADDSVENTLKTHLELCESAVNESGAELIIFAETALNFDFLADPYRYITDTLTSRMITETLTSFAKEHEVTMVIGTFASDEQNSYNSLVIFYPDGTIEDEPYNKRRLVPFGEYVPMESVIRKVFPFLADMNLFEGQITAGESSEIKKASGGLIGRLICFDSIYDYLTRQTVADGAEMIILSTNDSWYLDSPAVQIHNDHAKLRAVESGKYVLRAANTGVSAIIDPLGRVTSELEPLVYGYVSGEAVFNSERTLYSYTGNLIIPISFCVIAFEVIAKLIDKRKSKL